MHFQHIQNSESEKRENILLFRWHFYVIVLLYRFLFKTPCDECKAVPNFLHVVKNIEFKYCRQCTIEAGTPICREVM
ncbi:hypothetical protein XENTR_v10021079 [Xenopus tropicalis]|nr:hypothetical protein XENTR_v10021079 [Xenopus tropicalis]